MEVRAPCFARRRTLAGAKLRIRLLSFGARAIDSITCCNRCSGMGTDFSVGFAAERHGHRRSNPADTIALLRLGGEVLASVVADGLCGEAEYAALVANRERTWARSDGGMLIAIRKCMAAVLALVLLPIIASVGFMVKVVLTDLSVGSAIAGLAFLLLAGGVFVGLFNMVRRWEDEEIGDR
jgi:hypothetical protein